MWCVKFPHEAVSHPVSLNIPRKEESEAQQTMEREVEERIFWLFPETRPLAGMYNARMCLDISFGVRHVQARPGRSSAGMTGGAWIELFDLKENREVTCTL